MSGSAIVQLIHGFEFEPNHVKGLCKEAKRILKKVQKKGAVYSEMDDSIHPEVLQLKALEGYGYFRVFHVAPYLAVVSESLRLKHTIRI